MAARITFRGALGLSEFRQLVRGETVIFETLDGGAELQLILSDIGWSAMITAIREAEADAERVPFSWPPDIGPS